MRFSEFLDRMPAGRHAAAAAAIANAAERLDLALHRLWDRAPAEMTDAALDAERALAAALDALDLGATCASGRRRDAVSVTEALDAATEARVQLVRALARDEPPETVASFLTIALESLGDARRGGRRRA